MCTAEVINALITSLPVIAKSASVQPGIRKDRAQRQAKPTRAPDKMLQGTNAGGFPLLKSTKDTSRTALPWIAG
ncbi:MAG: hypothetical protein U1E97_05020 [Alphaproteobacteria bacterium]